MTNKQPENNKITELYKLTSKTKNKLNPFIIYLRSALKFISQLISLISFLLSQWTVNIVIILTVYYLYGRYYQPHLLIYQNFAEKNKGLLLYVIRGTLVYSLGWVIILTVHQGYHNDYMRILKADNRQGYKHLIFFNIRMAFFYQIAILMQANHYTNRLLAVLLLYIWLSQKYIRTAMLYNLHSIVIKRMQFVCNFSMNQATSLVFIVAPLAAVIAPELPWLPGFVTLFPILCRFTQCFVVGTHQQYLNSIKFTLNLIGFGFSVVSMPTHSHYWRIAAAAYSFYWDVFRDWKWKIRFIQKKNYRIDLPLIYFVLGGLYDIFGRTIWILMPMSTQNRGIVQMTRRLAWNMLRIQREQVFYFSKPQNNKVKDLFS